jgi:hypothetical protein
MRVEHTVSENKPMNTRFRYYALHCMAEAYFHHERRRSYRGCMPTAITRFRSISLHFLDEV